MFLSISHFKSRRAECSQLSKYESSVTFKILLNGSKHIVTFLCLQFHWQLLLSLLFCNFYTWMTQINESLCNYGFHLQLWFSAWKSRMAHKMNIALNIALNIREYYTWASARPLAAMAISSTYWAHLSDLTKGSKYSRTVLLKADRDRFDRWANLRKAKVLLQSWMQIIGLTVHLPSASNGTLVNSPICKNNARFPAMRCAASAIVVTGWLCWL